MSMVFKKLWTEASSPENKGEETTLEQFERHLNVQELLTNQNTSFTSESLTHRRLADLILILS